MDNKYVQRNDLESNDMNVQKRKSRVHINLVDKMSLLALYYRSSKTGAQKSIVVALIR